MEVGSYYSRLDEEEGDGFFGPRRSLDLKDIGGLGETQGARFSPSCPYETALPHRKDR